MAGYVEIRDGNVFVDGRIQRKSLEQLRDIRVLVHDDRHRPSLHALPARWLGRPENTAWKVERSGYFFPTSRDADQRNLDWLDYQQWTCWPTASPTPNRLQRTAVMDHYAYNQGLSRAALLRVSDIMLCCQIRVQGPGRLVIRIADRRDQFDLELQPARSACRLLHNEAVVLDASPQLDRQPWELEYALCDQRVLVSIDGTTVIRHAYQPSAANTDTDPPPLSIGAAGVTVRVLTPRVYRDIHYLGPNGASHWKSPQPLADNQWFVLGDNVPISVDSRSWSAIPAKVIQGPVIELGCR
jgi:signal peptidase I